MTTPAEIDPDVIRTVRQFRARLLAVDGAAAKALVEAYVPIWLGIKADIDSLIAEAMDRKLGPAQMERLTRLEIIQKQMAQEMTKFATYAGGRITTAQRQSVDLALQGARRIADMALPPRITTSLLARAGIDWINLPVEAFANFVGFSRDGAPLANLLDQLSPQVRQGVSDSIGEGLARGFSPRDTALLVRNRVGMGLTRALAISRTETLRSYREASRLQYFANRHIIKQYRRVSAKDDRVCPACMALDDKVYQVEVPLDAHVNCRCAIVPETVGYRELGIPVDTPSFERETARDWFQKQSTETQRKMLGAGRFEAWQAGEFALEDMAKVESSSVWGKQAVTKPLKEMTS